jgi:hypothetical protein
MKTNQLRGIAATIVTLLSAPISSAQNIQDLLPLQSGYVVATCHSSTSFSSNAQNPNGFVMGIIDATAPELAAAPTDIAGAAYPWRMFHNEMSVQNPGAPDPLQEWTAGNLGEIFGITLDDAVPPNIYVTATAAYGPYPVPVGNSQGTVYKLDGTTGDITPYNCITAGAASLGNATHWRASGGAGHLYVSNLDDGLIYQLEAAGACVGTFDHGVQGRPQESLSVQPDTAAVYTPTGRRIWGLKAHQDRLYYGVWNSQGAHKIWSVGLDAGGVPIAATAQIEIPVIPGSYPVSDIAFSEDGRLLLAQRGHRGAGFGGSHQHYVLEYVFDGTNWIVSPNDKFKVGNYSSGRNSAGGVDVDCSGAVWASGDALNYPAPYIYGISRIPAAGNQADSPHGANSHLIDLDGIITGVPKTYIGDVEIYDVCSPCFDITDISVLCPQELNAPFTATFTLTNRSNHTAAYLWHTPCPSDQLPAGATSGPLLQVGPQALSLPLAPGDSTTVTVQIPSGNAHDIFCWNLTLLDETGAECCTDKVCITLPDCECFIVLEKKISCEIDATGAPKYTIEFDLLNTSTFAWHNLNLLPPSLFSTATFDLSGAPVPPGGTYQFKTCITGNPGDAICFNISVHSEGIEFCCSKECCIILPPCDGVKVDRCDVTRQAPCCRDADGNVIASVTLTVCNNSAFPRSYDWKILPRPLGAGCNAVLTASAFVMPSGSFPVGPNSCVSIVIPVNCEELQPGDRACFEVCVEQQGVPSNSFCCEGQVYVPFDNEPVIKIQDPVLNADSPLNVLTVSNPGAESRRFVFEVSSLTAVTEISSPDGSREGGAPNQLITLDLRGGETRKVEIFILLSKLDLPPTSLNPILITAYNEQGQISQLVGSFVFVLSQNEEGLAIKDMVVNRAGQITFRIATQAGKRYAMESSASLGGDQAWTSASCSAPGSPEIVTEFIAQGSELVLKVMPLPDCPAYFYRVTEVPPVQ